MVPESMDVDEAGPSNAVVAPAKNTELSKSDLKKKNLPWYGK